MIGCLVGAGSPWRVAVQSAGKVNVAGSGIRQALVGRAANVDVTGCKTPAYVTVLCQCAGDTLFGRLCLCFITSSSVVLQRSAISLSVCLFVWSHISKTTRPNFMKFCFHVIPSSRRSVLLLYAQYVMYFRFCGWRYSSRIMRHIQIKVICHHSNRE